MKSTEAIEYRKATQRRRNGRCIDEWKYQARVGRMRDSAKADSVVREIFTCIQLSDISFQDQKLCTVPKISLVVDISGT